MFLSSHSTNMFIHLFIIAAVSNFNVYKLIGWDPGNTTNLKPTVETLENDAKKQVWNMFKVTNKNSQRRSGDLLTDK